LKALVWWNTGVLSEGILLGMFLLGDVELFGKNEIFLEVGRNWKLKRKLF
jgi:hypothetical protein